MTEQEIINMGRRCGYNTLRECGEEGRRIIQARKTKNQLDLFENDEVQENDNKSN